MPKRLVHIVRVSPRDRDFDTLTLHTTEGANRPGVTDLTGLAAFFEHEEADATWGVDAEGNRIRMKADSSAPWTNGFHEENHRSVTIEQVGFSATSKRAWVREYHNGLLTVADIAANYKAQGKIRLRKGHGGINQHKDISGPGGHTDCGCCYPQAYVTAWALYLYHSRKGHKTRAKAYAAVVKRVQRRYGLKPNLGYRG
jgi:hypothetical protein